MTKGERILALENELTIALTRLAQAEVRISLLEQGQRTSPYLAGESASHTSAVTMKDVLEFKENWPPHKDDPLILHGVTS